MSAFEFTGWYPATAAKIRSPLLMPAGKPDAVHETHIRDLQREQVRATRSIRQAEVGATKTMLERVKDKFDLTPERLIADTAYGTGPMLGWLVNRKIAPPTPQSSTSPGAMMGPGRGRTSNGTPRTINMTCPEVHELKQFRRNYSDPNRRPTGKGTASYCALKEVSQACPSKAKCCP